MDWMYSGALAALGTKEKLKLPSLSGRKGKRTEAIPLAGIEIIIAGCEFQPNDVKRIANVYGIDHAELQQYFDEAKRLAQSSYAKEQLRGLQGIGYLAGLAKRES
jgi:hypothetical protein